ncbi:hypothetical protein JTE90_016937 [Oedothorax gibbosus]|uniref:Uncharacterized protein n=1 Tax=Oedothorax gibbosus TaxID=931172 RepID=A0AAV6USV6_9ARAC|nr:hypothetical protein JTE90_016937 [Oedothorax gibbosus]
MMGVWKEPRTPEKTSHLVRKQIKNIISTKTSVSSVDETCKGVPEKETEKKSQFSWFGALAKIFKALIQRNNLFPSI